MADEEQQGQPSRKKKVETPEEQAARVEREKEQLLQDVAADVMAFKACVVEQASVKGRAKEKAVLNLYHELAVSGVEHEVGRGRVELPRYFSLVKDADDGTDALGLPELERRLKVSCKDYFAGQLTVESVMSAKSDESPLLQLADLFSGAVARAVNPVAAKPNQKDDFVAFVQALAGFPLNTPGSTSDFIYVRRLG